MKSLKFRTAAIAAAALAAVIFACGWLHLSGVGCFSLSLPPTPDPKVAAEEFFECVKQGDFAACSDYIYNFSDLDFDTAPELDAGTVLKQGLVDNFEYEIISVRKMGATATIEVELTTLDLDLLNEDYKDAAMQVAEDAAWTGVDIYTPEYALQAASDAAELLLEDPQPYLVTERYEIRMVYFNSRWQIECDDELFYALIGTPGRH